MSEISNRKAAPKVSVDVAIESEREELVKLYGSDCEASTAMVNGKLEKVAPKNHLFFGDANESDNTYVRRGYVPVKDDNGDHVNHRGDKLWKCPQKLHQKRADMSAKKHNAQMSSVMKTSVDGRELNDSMSAPGD